MDVVVTGHKGFIGPHVMERFPDAVGLDIKDGNDILECELPPADVVIHLAAQPGVIKSVEDPANTVRQNIEGTVRLLKHYKDAKFIFASSGGTIQHPIESPYGMSKWCGEQFVDMMHDNAVKLRFPNVFGTGSRSVVDKWLNEDFLTIYGDGETYRIYAHVEDVADAIQKSVDWKPGLYTLGSDQRYSVNDIAAAIGKLTTYAPARDGEIHDDRSQLRNNTPNWEAQYDVMDYIVDVTARKFVDAQRSNTES